MHADKFLFLLTLFYFTSCGPAPEMPQYESAKVELIDKKDQKEFHLLPLKGKIHESQKFWSGDYWALNRGIINYRWNSPYLETFDYTSPSKEEAQLLSQPEIAALSPSEKFDLYRGRYNYPLKAQVYTHADSYAQDWEGICNGWAPASMNHNEPIPKTVVNPDGIVIPFGSADIKALLSYYYAFIHKVNDTQQLGRRCPRNGGLFNWNEDCKTDLDAGAFHVVMANKVGLKKQSFMVDIERFKEVWNHPITEYESLIENEKSVDRHHVEGVIKVIRLKSKVTYVDESDENTWGPIKRTLLQNYVSRDYTYDLYLNFKNEIIGGKWISRDRPDFLWIMGPPKNFEGLLVGLNNLTND